MQTKNINLERAPTNNNELPSTNKKMLIMHNNSSTEILEMPEAAPPIPPRNAIIFTPLPSTPKIQVEVDGYGPYKPVPPPKPLSQQQHQQQQHQQQQHQQNSTCLTPPPYRMPPYPLYNEPSASIPGAAAGLIDAPIATSSPAAPQNFQTHSSKFPIEREVILSSTDKNNKIPILHDYMKRSKGAIAPDVPPKQMAAWTQGQSNSQQQGQQQQILSPDQNHSGHIQTPQHSHPTASDPNGSLYRATFHGPQEYYNGQQSTGAVPRSSWHGDPKTRQYQQEDLTTNPSSSSSQQVAVQIEKDQQQKDNNKPKAMTKTYHTLKDMISSKFSKNSKECDEKTEEPGLNNVTEEMRKSGRSHDKVDDEADQKKTAGEQGIYGKPRTDQISIQQHQYNQHIIQQHMLAQQALQTQQQQQQQQQHFQSANPPYKNQMYPPPQQPLVQARSQEMLAQRQDDQCYYQNSYGSPQRTAQQRYNLPQSRDNYLAIHQQQQQQYETISERCVDERKPLELRSPQQIERDNLRQKHFESRRTASQPQLAYDDEQQQASEFPDHRAQPQSTAIAPIAARRGSHGNIMEATREHEKDSDDGGFLKRNNSQERRLDASAAASDNAKAAGEKLQQADDDKVNSLLSGTPRKRLEGEIGKIEGVYNVAQRGKTEGDETRSRRQATGSGASSDYDKNGPSSSNADSGRGSAAYSSGRRPCIDTGNESELQAASNGNYRDANVQGHDAEWVDIVETELRHILEPKLHELSLHGNGAGIANSTMSESISSMTPPLPPLSPGEQSSPNVTPRNSARYKHSSSLPYGSKPDYEHYNKSKSLTQNMARWHAGSNQKHRGNNGGNGKKTDHGALLRGKQMFGLDTTDLTSTTTRSLDLESMLDGQSDSDGDISTTDARAIRKQLEGLESMYSEVLKLLGVKKYTGRYQPSDPRFSKRRYGSMSSLPSSSVSSRPIRDKRRGGGGGGGHDDRKKVRDIRGVNKRFQRLESHVVTLARSVAHLSSEMRTQHLMIQEMENIRGEIAALRTQTNMLNVRSQSATRAVNSSKDLPNLANPTRVKKLTKFFGDEPPLLRLFLRKLGYEKYANVFENEKVGMVELPYLSEERLQKMGVPLGPRLRIMQEAQISVCKENTLCIV